jgi:hypothetical protein
VTFAFVVAWLGLPGLIVIALADDVYREWADSSGTHKTEAKLIKIGAETVTLEKRDGSFKEVEIARLSTQDQQYIRDKKTAAAARKSTTRDDLKKLQGKWRTADKSPDKLEMDFEIGPGPPLKVNGQAAFRYDGKQGQTWCTSCPRTIQEGDGRRSLSFDAAITITSKLPSVWFYKFDGGNLILSVDEGDYKGEYRLGKAIGKADSPAKTSPKRDGKKGIVPEVNLADFVGKWKVGENSLNIDEKGWVATAIRIPGGWLAGAQPLIVRNGAIFLSIAFGTEETTWQLALDKKTTLDMVMVEGQMRRDKVTFTKEK